jgi:hypothetical protein
MSKQLVLLFTAEEEDWDWISNYSEKEFYPIPEEKDRPENSGCAMVLLKDWSRRSFSTGKEDNQDAIGHLEKAESWADEVYVAIHKRSNHKQDKLLSHSKMTKREYQHEKDGDQIYGAFCNVIKSCKESGAVSDETKKYLKDLVGAFNVSWLLETKLEMLHRCLTPEGAKTLIPTSPGEPENFPDKYSDEKTSLMDEELDEPPLEGSGAGWTVGDVVRALANQPRGVKEIPFDDCSDAIYQSALRSMRDTLLRDEFQ